MAPMDCAAPSIWLRPTKAAIYVQHLLNPAYEAIQRPIAPAAPRYRDAWPLVHGRHPHAPTFCVHSQVYSKTPYCCDFAFVSEALAPRVRSIEVDSDTTASDHQPELVGIDDL